MLLTTSHDIQGYFISNYLDVVFDEMIFGIGLFKSISSTFDNVLSSFTGTEATIMIEKVNEVKAELRQRVIQKAEALGANALIGIDFESSKMGDLIMVSMTATAVVAERIIEPLPYTEANQRQMEQIIAEEKAAAEQRQREETEKAETEMNLKKLRQTGDTSALFHLIEKYSSCDQMMKELEKYEEVFPVLRTPDLQKTLQSFVRKEWVYGAGSKKQDFLNVLQAALH